MITLREMNRRGLINKIRWIKGNITFWKNMKDKLQIKKYKKMLKEYEKELKRGELK